LNILLASIAAISLLVGGIGIMNIMLVSVTERTREIGIRMAVGAKGLDIVSQFLWEALLLCFCGGAFGMVLGIGAVAISPQVMGWPARISLDSAALALGFAGAIGLFFGFYPAYAASRLDPVDALRHEM
jgi:putative ABC transport system permease protein